MSSYLNRSYSHVPVNEVHLSLDRVWGLESKQGLGFRV